MGVSSGGGAAGVCGLPWLLQRPAPRQPQTPPLSRSDLQVDGMGHPHDSGDRVRQSHLAQVVLQPRNGAKNGPRPGHTAAAAAQPAPTLVLCTLTVAVWLLAGRAISIRHKASATALRVPATPRACSKNGPQRATRWRSENPPKSTSPTAPYLRAHAPRSAGRRATSTAVQTDIKARSAGVQLPGRPVWSHLCTGPRRAGIIQIAGGGGGRQPSFLVQDDAYRRRRWPPEGPIVPMEHPGQGDGLICAQS